jgi:hypothetical protein
MFRLIIPVSLLLIFSTFPSIAKADHVAPSITQLTIGGDYFWNWDFNSQSASASNVDWPITMLHWNNADVNFVKGIYYGNATYAVNKNFRLNDGLGWTWVSDKGTKSEPGSCLGSAWHMRVYADADGRMYNPSWGFYVLASTHKDVRELCNAETGFSEAAEAQFRSLATQAGQTVLADSVWFYNNDGPRWAGNHYVDVNGWASSVEIQ